jgi:two-component sensor histidine kinase
VTVVRDADLLDADGVEGVVADHLRRLLGYWGLLADLSFSDLLLCRPSPAGGEAWGMRVVAQVRPTTGQTLYPEDLVNEPVRDDIGPWVVQAWRTGRLVDAEDAVDASRIQCIPVRCSGQVVAVVVRRSALVVGRRPGLLERTYVELFERFARMISEGTFPFPIDDLATEGAPRVGDGVIVLDAGGRVSFASPNAISALHRMGITTNAVGSRLEEIGLGGDGAPRAMEVARPILEEVTRPGGVAITFRTLPLLTAGRVDGAVVLLRDVSDLRRRDRLLLSKDATIREIHHRVKNNLQTISSLLRLQGRRLSSDEGRQALAEAERRIRSIAVVHDVLSRDVGDRVRFDDIVEILVRMAEQSLMPGQEIGFTLSGEAGELPGALASALAVVISELLQNAVEHAFPPGAEGRVRVVFAREPASLVVEVADDGVGLPPGFELEHTDSLGLLIVRDLVRTQLDGSLELRPASDGQSGRPGLAVGFRVPLREPDAGGL